MSIPEGATVAVALLIEDKAGILSVRPASELPAGWRAELERLGFRPAS